MIKKTNNFDSKSQFKNKEQQQTKKGSEEKKMIEAQKRKANREALHYNDTAGCCHFPLPPQNNLVWSDYSSGEIGC